MPVLTEQSCLNQAGCIALAQAYNLAAPGANTNWFTPVSVGPNASAIRITFSLGTTSKVDVRVTDGTNAFSIHLNANADCTADCMYTFVFGARRTSTAAGSTVLTYSLRSQTNGIVQYATIEEVVGPVT